MSDHKAIREALEESERDGRVSCFVVGSSLRALLADLDEARAALTAAKAGGWVAVPVEPTPEMIREVEHAARLGAVWTAASVYKAMLAARPTTPPKEQSAWGLGLVDAVAHPRSATE